MAIPATALDNLGRQRAIPPLATDGPASTLSAVSWGAIIAGAAGAAALSLILLILGTGLGLSSVSPWANSGVSAAGLGFSAILWLTLTQLIASGAGGYLAGRLRTRWSGVHTDEVYFRDTAHGFLAWALASLVTASLLASTVGSIVSGGVQASASVAGGAAGGATTAMAAMTAKAASTMPGGKATGNDGGDSGPLAYFVDSLFRKPVPDAVPAAAGASSASTGAVPNGTSGDQGSPSSSTSATSSSTSPMSTSTSTSGASATSEVTRIFMNTLSTGSLAPEDMRYVGMIVAQRTGLSQAEAEKRVTDTYTRLQTKLRDAEATARDAADKARKASAYAALWLFISLLAGAFVASLSATFGGRQRDL